MIRYSRKRSRWVLATGSIALIVGTLAGHASLGATIGVGGVANDETSVTDTRRPIGSDSADRSSRPVPTSRWERGRQGAESAAKELALAYRALPTRDGEFDDQERYCARHRMHVRWARPTAAEVQQLTVDSEPVETVKGAIDSATAIPSTEEASSLAPLGRFRHGAFIGPLGPVPTESTLHANGIVFCRGSDYAYAGVEVFWKGDAKRWDAWLVPTE